MSFFSKLSKEGTRELEIVFAGGLGTQILQAAVYFDHELQNIPVYADLSYFGKPAKIADAGVKGALSRWPWYLDQYGLGQHHLNLRRKNTQGLPMGRNWWAKPSPPWPNR